MSIIEKKEKNLNQLINKLNSLSITYSQPNYEVEKIKTEKNELLRQKIKKLELDVKKKLDFENNLNQEIEDLSQETENLVTEIEKWQM